jgi:hypothetical protein
MPVFNFEGQGAPTINSGFKYYWAVSIPLRICVLVFWGLAMMLPWHRWVSTFRGKPKGEDGLELQHVL